MSNSGHRLGETIKTAPENTIQRMKDNLKYQIFDDFKYWEFDVNETADKQLIIYHDRDFKKLGDKALIREVKFEYVRDNYPHIPTLQELMEAMAKERITRPIRIEIKRLISDDGRRNILDIAQIFRNKIQLDTKFMAFRSHFKKSFPEESRKYWSLVYEDAGFKILNVKNKRANLFGHEPWYKRWFGWILFWRY